MKSSIKVIFNIPNSLSIVRICLIPIFVFLYLKAHYLYAAITLILSGLTDFVDGYVARHYNQITEMGKLLDPAADKLTQAAVVVVLAIHYPQIAPMLALFIVKEVLMLIGGYRLMRSGKKPGSSKWWGKLATMVFYLIMIVIVAFGHGFSDLAVTILVAVAAIFMLFSFINYIPIFFKLKSGENINE